MKKLKKENKGFSLVELIVVVLILGILAVAVTPQIMNWIDKSKENKDLSYAGSVATAVESVALEYYGVKGSIENFDYYVTDKGVKLNGVAEKNGLHNNTVTGQSVKALNEEITEVIAKFQNPENTKNKSFKVSVTITDGVISVDCDPVTTVPSDYK
jgi:type IV pilus assembly protein PilA